ncbi:MAG: TauD/TfdA family dioxygenase [Proteobacteria bacterium]|nr:TauD/TfdA family dioxygenase [Pseudomonadota bacterium]
MSYKHIDVKPLSGACGAEIFGVDLAKPLKKDVLGEIKQAWLYHQVIFFRDQDITPEKQIRFAKKFGGIHHHRLMKAMDGYPDILEIVKLETDARNFGNNWHTDQIFTPNPAKATMLYAKEVPPYGGDTQFSNMTLAYEALSLGMRKMIAGLKAESTSNHNRVRGGRAPEERYKGHSTMRAEKAPTGVQTTSCHPLVRTHPETGRKSLYIGAHTIGIKDLALEEALPLINYLQTYAQRPEFTCRFRWEENSLAFWDNRCVLHYAVDDYAGFRRVMRRITIKGDRPR